MSRSTQFIGHTDKVSEFLDTCKKLNKIDSVTGMFDEEVHDLYTYQDNKGNTWVEFIQYEIWSSGPMIFLGLRNINDNTILGWERKNVEILTYEYDPQKGEIYI